MMVTYNILVYERGSLVPKTYANVNEYYIQDGFLCLAWISDKIVFGDTSIINLNDVLIAIKLETIDRYEVILMNNT